MWNKVLLQARILQARILKWAAIPFSKGSFQARDQNQLSSIAGRFFTSWATREAQETGVGSQSLLQQIFLTQELNQDLLHFLVDSLPAKLAGKPQGTAQVQFSSVAQSCPTLCDPMNCSTQGLPVHHQLPEFTQTHIHRVGDAIQPSHPLSSPSPPAPNPSQHQSFPMSQLFFI